jgi:5-methylcytosine-specific restriction endonuclease McrA
MALKMKRGAFSSFAKVLLLNGTYEPLQIIAWERAIVLALLDKVEVIETYTEKVHSPSHSLLIPAVVKLRKYVQPKRYEVRFTRHNIYMRDHYQCQYCGRVLHPEQLTYDHVIPRSKGGKINWQNIVTCCIACNKRKGKETLEQAGMQLRRFPARPPNPLVFLLETHGAQVPGCWNFYLNGSGQYASARNYRYAY